MHVLLVTCLLCMCYLLHVCYACVTCVTCLLCMCYLCYMFVMHVLLVTCLLCMCYLCYMFVMHVLLVTCLLCMCYLLHVCCAHVTCYMFVMHVLLAVMSLLGSGVGCRWTGYRILYRAGRGPHSLPPVVARGIGHGCGFHSQCNSRTSHDSCYISLTLHPRQPRQCSHAHCG